PVTCSAAQRTKLGGPIRHMPPYEVLDSEFQWTATLFQLSLEIVARLAYHERVREEQDRND
ncbi:MAG: hypothetical protein V2A73_04365, partial [Pseudomonadota bacterium]